MPKHWLLLLSLFSFSFLSKQSEAALMIGINPSSLNFAGPGAHSVAVTLTHDGLGLSTISGYTIRFGSPLDASAGVLPTDVVAVTATEVFPLSDNALFSLNTGTSTVSSTRLGGDVDVGIGGTVTLFNLNLNLGNAPTYTIGLDFQNAERGGFAAIDISGEFTGQNSPTTDLTFTLTAVPEPSSVLMLSGTFGIALAIRRRVQKVTAAQV